MHLTSRRGLVPLLVTLVLSACGGFSNAMERGDDAMRRHDYDAAVKAYRHAVKLEPDDKQARVRLAEAEQAAVGTRLDGARTALAAGELEAAAAAIAEADKIQPGDREVAELSREVLDATVRTGRVALDEQRYADARALYAGVGPLLKDPEARLVKADRTAVEAWSGSLAVGRDAALAAKRTADALLQHRMLIELQPTAVDRAKCTQLVSQLRPRFELVVGQRMLEVAPPDGERRGGGRGPKGSRDRTTPEQRFSALSRAVAGERPTQWLRLTTPDEKGVKTALVIAHAQGDTRISDRHERETRVQEYQAGTRLRPNPEYGRQADLVREAERRNDHARERVEARQAQLDAAQAAVTAEGPSPDAETDNEKKLAEAQRALDMARDEHGRARDELRVRRDALAQIPERFEEPVMELLRYDVMHHSVRASGSLVTAIDRGNKKGEPKEWPLGFEAMDDAHAAQPPIGLPADPLTLPDDRTLRERVADQALQTLEAVVQEVFAGVVGDQRQKAMALNGDARVEQLVVYLLMDKAVSDREVDQLLFEVRGIPNASALLDDCGQTEGAVGSR